MQEAMLYEQLEENAVRCNLCAHRCRIAEGRFGVCQVRENVEGTLYTHVYGRPISQNVDPVEKKPLYHFQPGSRAYSIATAGCNFRCHWCQNWQIAQMPREQGMIAGREASPQAIVEGALATGCASIAYTYTEPTIFFEYSYHTAKLARENGLANLYVTNGYMTGEMLDAFEPYLDGANVDLKAFRDETYRRYMGARLQPVLDSLKSIKARGIWLEVTTLIVPDLNDDPAEMRDVAEFIATELGPDTPWHISRYHPAYRLVDRGPTPVNTLKRARAIGQEAGIRHIYIGNVAGVDSDTQCPACGKTLINRRGYLIRFNRVQDGRCPGCGELIAGVALSG